MVSPSNTKVTQHHTTRRLLLRGTLAWKGGRQRLWDVRMEKKLAAREHEALLDNTLNFHSMHGRRLLRCCSVQSFRVALLCSGSTASGCHFSTPRETTTTENNTKRHPALSVAGHQAWVMTCQGKPARRSTISSHKYRLAPSCPGKHRFTRPRQTMRDVASV